MIVPHNTADIKVEHVPPCMIGHRWEEIETHLQEGDDYWKEYYTLGSILTAILTGEMQVWEVLDKDDLLVVALTEFVDFPMCSVLRIIWIGGKNLRHAISALDFAEFVALRSKCSKVQFFGREGLERFVAPRGYRQHSVLYEKDLKGMREH